MSGGGRDVVRGSFQVRSSFSSTFLLVDGDQSLQNGRAILYNEFVCFVCVCVCVRQFQMCLLICRLEGERRTHKKNPTLTLALMCACVYAAHEPTCLRAGVLTLMRGRASTYECACLCNVDGSIAMTPEPNMLNNKFVDGFTIFY